MRALPLALALAVCASSGSAQDHSRPAHPCDQSAPIPALSALPDPAPRIADVSAVIARAPAVMARSASDPGRPAALLELAEAYRARGEGQEAIRALATIVQDHPGWSSIDEVLSRLAVGLAGMQQHDRARQVFMRLIRNHPTSVYVQAAYLSFADYYFSEHDYTAAQRFTERALSMSGPTDAYARYRHAWTLAAQGDTSALAELDRARSQASATGQVGGAAIAAAAAQDRAALDRWARCAR